MNKNQWQKFPNYFANNFKLSKENFEQKNETKNKKFKSEDEPKLASCPVPPAPTDEQLASCAAQIAQAMKVESCNTKSFSLQAETQIMFASASLNINASSSVGCEQIMAMANSYYQSQQNITCIMKQSLTENQTVVSGINKVIFNPGGDLTINCANEFVIDQKMQIRLVQLAQMSQEQKNEISRVAKATTEDILNTLQDSKSGFGATPQGQKYISESKSKIESLNFEQNVAQSINKITTQVQGGNTIQFNAGGNIYITGKDCKITQDTLLDVMATSILNDQITTVFDSLSELTKKTQTSNTQTAVNEGAPNLFEGKWIQYLLMGVALIVLLGGAAWVASKQDFGEISKNIANAASPVSAISSVASSGGLSKLSGLTSMIKK